MESFTTEDLIAELQEYYQPVPDRREGGVTRQEFAEAQNISIKMAGKLLEDLVTRGILVRETNRLGPSAKGYVYYKK